MVHMAKPSLGAAYKSCGAGLTCKPTGAWQNKFYVHSTNTYKPNLSPCCGVEPWRVVPCNAVQDGAVSCSAVRHSAARCHALQCHAVKRGAVRYGAVLDCAVQAASV
ncbi:hypothetical protein Anapl_06423 [Anas platyrhynchos]|uniref:Uncharacterized protein n=1 Tax=Anas platyrhynchos TaxID=8839 RepID=R0LMB5_ANAPL|nr:hypothetical protein Anapl_06423 [Anas platyrhynchos]